MQLLHREGFSYSIGYLNDTFTRHLPQGENKCHWVAYTESSIPFSEMLAVI